MLNVLKTAAFAAAGVAVAYIVGKVALSLLAKIPGVGSLVSKIPA